MENVDGRPMVSELLWMTIMAMRSHDGIAKGKWIALRVAEDHPDVAAAYAALPPETPLSSTLTGRLAWSRTRLKEMGFVLYDKARWHLTESGWTVTEAEVLTLDAEASRRQSANKAKHKTI